jgi:hypothetical protein
MKKRGLSNLVATVLIILLALAAVALVWSFLQPSFERTGVQIDLGTECLNVDVKPVACTYDANRISTVTVQRSAGEISEIIVVVEHTDDTTTTNRTTAPDLLATKNYQVAAPSAAGETPDQAQVAAIVSDGVNSQVCAASATKVDCTAA